MSTISVRVCVNYSSATKQKSSDVIVIAKEGCLSMRLNDICCEFSFSSKRWNDTIQFSNENQSYQAKVVVLSITSAQNKIYAGQWIKEMRSRCKTAFILCVASKIFDAETLAHLEKCGADLIFLEHEVIDSSKLEFTLTQLIKYKFLPIKSSELVADKELTFNVYHLLPMRKKYLPVLFAGTSPSKQRLNMIEKVGEFYIQRHDTGAFSDYMNKHHDDSTIGIQNKCRGLFLSLFANYVSLALSLTTQSSHGDFKDGEELINQCRKYCKEILALLGETSDAHAIVTNSSIGDFGSVERAPAIAAYAGIFALLAEEEADDIESIMVGSLLTDLGIIMLPPDLTKKFRGTRLVSLTKEEDAIYRHHPTMSLNVLLSRRLQIANGLRKIITSTHERADGNGYPNQISGRIPIQSQYIAFCEAYDRLVSVRIGEDRPNATKVLIDLVTKSSTKYAGRFSDDFISQMKRVISKIEVKEHLKANPL
jgi:response regulator RpfG family c-di-GMP phosphodiesterase